MPSAPRSRFLPLTAAAAAAAAALLAACTPEGGRAAESEPGERHREAERSAAMMDDTGRRPEVVGDTVVFAADRRAASDSAEQALLAAQPDRVLLERLLDRYAAIDFVLNELQRDTRNGGARGRAWRHERSEDRETRRIEALLDAEFNERYEPAVGNRVNQTADSLLSLAPEAQNAAFEAMLLRVHRRSLQLIDSLTPRLQRPGVREGVRRLREHLVEEVAELEGR